MEMSEEQLYPYCILQAILGQIVGEDLKQSFYPLRWPLGDV